ncbi:MAG: acyl-CoA dehydrogenase family protein, partial [Rhodococcus sp. (in: high G+C Gram-positive bacteria)]
MSIATTEDQRDIQESIRSWVASAEPIGTLRADEQASWRAQWAGLAGLGVFSVAVPESAGGAGGTVADLAAMLEATAAGLVGGPVLTTALAAIVVGSVRSAEELCEGRMPCAAVLSGDPVRAAADGDDLVADGIVELAVGAVDGAAVLLPVLREGVNGGDIVWCMVQADTPGLEIEPSIGVDRSVPLGRVTLDAVRIAPGSQLPGVRTDFVHDLAAALASAEAAGVAGRCLDIAVEHARTRVQFGAPIGSFQAIKHLCADMLCRVEKARAVAWDAAVAVDSAPIELPLSAGVAGALALDAAVDTAKDCIQILGGIGFTWEHDAHLYLRRALVLRQVLGGSTRWRARAADAARRGVRRTLTVDLGEAELLRDTVRD